jgi:hypothetical protein
MQSSGALLFTMTNFPSLAQLKKAVLLTERLEQLQAELAAILGEQKVKVKVKAKGEVKAKKTRRTMSPEAREKIAAAQRKRWAKSKRAIPASAAKA